MIPEQWFNLEAYKCGEAPLVAAAEAIAQPPPVAHLCSGCGRQMPLNDATHCVTCNPPDLNEENFGVLIAYLGQDDLESISRTMGYAAENYLNIGTVEHFMARTIESYCVNEIDERMDEELEETEDYEEGEDADQAAMLERESLPY
jgi:hypothetical protein